MDPQEGLHLFRLVLSVLPTFLAMLPLPHHSWLSRLGLSTDQASVHQFWMMHKTAASAWQPCHKCINQLICSNRTDIFHNLPFCNCSMTLHIYHEWTCYKYHIQGVFLFFLIWFMSVFFLSTTCWYMANTPVNLGGMMCLKLLYAVHL